MKNARAANNAVLKINNKYLKICVKHLVSDKKKISSYVPNLSVHKAQVILLPPVIHNSLLKVGSVCTAVGLGGKKPLR